jgi:hypothetical protein
MKNSGNISAACLSDALTRILRAICGLMGGNLSLPRHLTGLYEREMFVYRFPEHKMINTKISVMIILGLDETMQVASGRQGPREG